ncbi:hypothetical protein NSQ45_12205 [Caldifermentibacillus hisashii]|uniref:hypothetical protein n=1 Tax=Caldifermentibacillus hisashii TaxID=996558 RepID=UPI0034D7ACD2
MVTRTSLVVEKERFLLQNGDENESRRQKMEYFGSKWRREKVSSPKNGVSRHKKVTRISLVAKKMEFHATKW